MCTKTIGCITRKLNPIRGRIGCEKKRKKKRRRSYLTRRPETSIRDTAIVMKVTLEIGVDDQSGRRFQHEIESRWRTSDRASKRREKKWKRTRKRGCVCGGEVEKGFIRSFEVWIRWQKVDLYVYRTYVLECRLKIVARQSIIRACSQTRTCLRWLR